MNVLDAYIEKHLERLFIEGINIMNNATAFQEFRKTMKADHGVFYIRYIKSGSDAYTIIAKRKAKQYTYSYKNNELILKGERTIC